MTIKLNLGCGTKKMPGFVNVDKFPTFSPDVVWDLETFPWPFEDNTAEEIVLHHTLEHLGQTPEIFLRIMQELYRISAPDAQLLIAVPHPRSDDFISDPTHVRPITPATLELFSKKRNIECQKLGAANSQLAMYLDVDFSVTSSEMVLTPYWAERYKTLPPAEMNLAFEHYFNVVNEIRITLTVIK